jgi:hypothetical protein
MSSSSSRAGSSKSDPEFDFDCPLYYCELKAADSRPDEHFDEIDPWFQTYHADHDWKPNSQAEVEKEKYSQNRTSISGAAKSISGPSRSAKHLSTASSIITQSVSARRSSQKSDDSKVDDNKPLLKAKRKSSAGDNRNSTESIDGKSAGSGDMRDKLDEFRQRKRKESSTDNNLVSTETTSAVILPSTDYSRSKILSKSTSSTVPIKVGSTSSTASSTTTTTATTTAAQLLMAKRLVAGLNKTSTTTKEKIIPSTESATARPVVSKPVKLASVANNRKLPIGSTATAKDAETDMMELLKKHNQRFAPIPVYEPPRHSVRDVRKWEKASGKLWSNLKPEEREVVNADIGRMKESNKL